MKTFILIVALVFLAGCDGRIHIPEDDYLYRTSPNEPGYEKIGVKIERWEQQKDEIEVYKKTIELLQNRIDRYQLQLAEARVLIDDLERRKETRN